jgi:hypothetical protein
MIAPALIANTENNIPISDLRVLNEELELKTEVLEGTLSKLDQKAWD